MQSLYKNVDKAQKMFYLKRKIKDMGRNVVSIFGLLILLAAIGVVIWFATALVEGVPQKSSI